MDKSIEYSGTLILEGNVPFNFFMTFDCQEDVWAWLNSIDNSELPTGDAIGVEEYSTNKYFLIPVNKILAYNVN